jgi:hypothetical protein
LASTQKEKGTIAMNEDIDWYARQVLTRPQSYMAYDDRWYTTHGCVMAWADRGDDLVAESNYHAARARLEAVARDGEDDVEDTSASHWLFGSVQELFVRVRDDDGQYTPAFHEAFSICCALLDYPILDDTDHSEREWDRFVQLLDEAIGDNIRQHDDDLEDDQVIYHLLTTAEYEDPWVYSRWPGESIDHDEVARIYGLARNYHFEFLARRAMSEALPGQQPLPLDLPTPV